MILDYSEKLSVTDEIAESEQNALNSLAYLEQGLHSLAGWVEQQEAIVTGRLDPAQVVLLEGNQPVLPDLPIGLLACTFHWYAGTACSYARLVGWLTHDRDRRHASAYVQRVLPEVKIWRDKVAAHFALTDPGEEDNPATLEGSAWFPVMWNRGRFEAHSFTLVKGAPPGRSRKDMRWSLTDTHRALCARYWPDAKRENLDADLPA